MNTQINRMAQAAFDSLTTDVQKLLVEGVLANASICVHYQGHYFEFYRNTDNVLCASTRLPHIYHLPVGR